MAVIKCKMCGGDLVLVEGQSVVECEYCGSRQTVPVADDEKKLTLFARANRLRAACGVCQIAGTGSGQSRCHAGSAAGHREAIAETNQYNDSTRTRCDGWKRRYPNQNYARAR